MFYDLFYSQADDIQTNEPVFNMSTSYSILRALQMLKITLHV